MEPGASHGFDLERHHDAFRAAAQRIHPHRRKMTLEDAQDIVRIEFARRRLSISAHASNQFALMMHRGPLWPCSTRCRRTKKVGDSLGRGVATREDELYLRAPCGYRMAELHAICGSSVRFAILQASRIQHARAG